MNSSVTHTHVYEESSVSGINWGAITGGAFAAMAVSLILLMLGSALELSSVSPWSSSAGSLTEFTAKMAIWLIIMQWIASGVGGYITGRLRTKWRGLHTDESFFRDTAHGFLAWAVATVVTAGLLTSAVTSAVSGGVHAASAVTAGAAAGAEHGPAQHGNMEPMGYYIDSLYRSSNPNPNVPNKDLTEETARILTMDVKDGSVTDADKAYLAQLISARTGLNQTDAAKRVDDTIVQMDAAKEKAKENVETARKAGQKFSLYLFLSMLVGAFIASVSAAHGGRHRDMYEQQL